MTLCNATAPKLGFGIAGKTFNFHPADLMYQPVGEGMCLTSILRGLNVSPGNIFGSKFLHNVVAVFDNDINAMQFAEHNY